MARPYKMKITVEWILSQAVKVDSGCIEFASYDVGQYGYQGISYEGNTVAVHRLIMQLSLGRVLLTEEHVLHSCDNPKCVNLDHLKLGTAKQNMVDCADKRRKPNMFSEEKVAEIRKKSAAGVPLNTLVKEGYGSKNAIRRIINRETYRTDP